MGRRDGGGGYRGSCGIREGRDYGEAEMKFRTAAGLKESRLAFRSGEERRLWPWKGILYEPRIKEILLRRRNIDGLGGRCFHRAVLLCKRCGSIRGRRGCFFLGPRHLMNPDKRKRGTGVRGRITYGIP